MDKILAPIKQRIVEIADNKEDNRKKFFEKLSVSPSNFRSKSLYSEVNGEIIAKILSVYPDVSADWLLTGEGQMIRSNYKVSDPVTSYKLKSDKIYENQITPLYNIEAVAGLRQLLDNQNSNIIDTIKIPNLPKCDGAIFITGDSMYPLLKSGDIILFKEVRAEDIFWGEMYLLSIRIDEWEEYLTVKYIQKSDIGRDHIKLVSQNQHHQPRDIKVNQITALALIKASIRMNTML